MQNKNRSFPNCMKGGCIWPSNCSRCGFDKREDARRKEIPLTVRESDGLRRKLIPRKPAEE